MILRADEQHTQNRRTGMLLFGTFIAMFIGSIIYVALYH